MDVPEDYPKKIAGYWKVHTKQIVVTRLEKPKDMVKVGLDIYNDKIKQVKGKK